MDEHSLHLYNVLTEYREHLKDMEAPEHFRALVDSVLSSLTHEEYADEDELELLASYVEEFDGDNQESEAVLDVIREYEENAA
jgi:endonuclease III